jgi:hypothetical protein
VHAFARLLHVNHQLLVSFESSLLRLKDLVLQILFPKPLKRLEIDIVGTAIVVRSAVHAGQAAIEFVIIMVTHVVIVALLLFQF